MLQYFTKCFQLNEENLPVILIHLPQPIIPKEFLFPSSTLESHCFTLIRTEKFKMVCTTVP